MNNDLNRRAAKALCLAENFQKKDHFYMGTNDIKLPAWGWRMVEDMYFHSNHHWSMMGVRAYMAVHADNIHMHLFNLENRIIDIMEPDLEVEESSERWTILRWQASPEQITQAWVELFEEMIKPDELELMSKIISNVGRLPDDLYEGAKWIKEERIHTILLKWTDKNIWNYGVSPRTGWLVKPDGILVFEQKINDEARESLRKAWKKLNE